MNQARVLLALGLGLALCCSMAADGAGIVGHIGTPAGVPVQGVTVTATRTSPFQSVAASTDAAGNYGFNGLFGTYDVVPSRPGYTFTPASSNVTVRALGLDEAADFTTPASLPLATTQPAQSVTATSATLQGSVNPDGAATTAWFQYGLTISYGSASASTSAGNGTNAVPVNIGVSGLVNGTNYHFRIVASNSFGVTFGNDLTFATPSGIPSVTMLAPTDGGATTMKLNGSVNPNGANATAWFEWGTTSGYGNTTAAQSLGGGVTPTNISQALTGLATGTSYHCRAGASTSFGTSYGADTLFTPLFSNIGVGLPGVSSGSASWGDFDNDGRLDILLTGSYQIVQVWRNTGSGFTNANINAPLPRVILSSGAWGDFDNDGRLDILLMGTTNSLGGASNSAAQVWRNTGSGFININAGLPGVFFGATAGWGDSDNDGRLDILLTGLSTIDAIAQVWRNTGGGFGNVNAGLPGFALGAVAWGDYDKDGLLDILLTGSLAGGNSYMAQVWRNTGSGFVNINAGLPGVYSSSVAWADYDNDGWLDILLTGYSPSGPISQVWRNTGSGFVNINAGLPGVYSSSVAWGDYDNDGRLDCLVTGSVNGSAAGAAAQLYHNNGDGTFTGINPGLPAVFRSSVAWGDFDNDGRLDILMTGLNTSNQPITMLWRNNVPTSNTRPSAPSSLGVTVSNSVVALFWNAASDNETRSAGLTYNVRIGTTPGGSDVLSPMSDANGFRRVPQLGNAQQRLFTRLENRPAGTTYYWSVQAVDTALAGSAFAPESSFKFAPTLMPITSTTPIPGDLNADGVVDQNEMNTVLSNYWPNSGWLQMTNPMKLNDGYFQFALTNASSWDLSVLVSSNLTDWDFLGLAFPVYQFADPASSNAPNRFYRLRWP